LFGSLNQKKIAGLNLVKLNISNNNIDKHGVIVVCDFLVNSKQIKELNIAKNYLQTEGTE